MSTYDPAWSKPQPKRNRYKCTAEREYQLVLRLGMLKLMKHFEGLNEVMNSRYEVYEV